MNIRHTNAKTSITCKAFTLISSVRLAPSLSSLSDEELAAKAAAGSMNHFDALVKRYSKAIYRFAYRLSGEHGQAEEVVQETFIKVFRALPKTRLDLPLKPWLYKIALNTSISLSRKNSRRQTVDLEMADLLTGKDNSYLIDEKIDAQTAINALSFEHRQIIVLRAVEDLAFAQIAQILEIPEATARTRFQRAKTALKLSLS